MLWPSVPARITMSAMRNDPWMGPCEVFPVPVFDDQVHRARRRREGVVHQESPPLFTSEYESQEQAPTRN